MFALHMKSKKQAVILSTESLSAKFFLFFFYERFKTLA